MNCGDCKYWFELDFRVWAQDRYGREHSVEVSWGHCRREDHADSPMYTEDGSAYWSALHTKRSFSCSAWEEGDEAELLERKAELRERELMFGPELARWIETGE